MTYRSGPLSGCAGLTGQVHWTVAVQVLKVRSIEYWVCRTYRWNPLNCGCAGLTDQVRWIVCVCRTYRSGPLNYRCAVGYVEGRKPFRKPKLREGNCFKLHLKIGVTMWTGFIWLSTLITTVMNILFQRKFGKSLSSRTTFGFLRRTLLSEVSIVISFTALIIVVSIFWTLFPILKTLP
jgi:hypothetical protein